jgi:hypothetical protein
MLRKLALVFLPLALLAAACGGGGGTDTSTKADPPTSISDDTDTDEGDTGASDLFSTLNPLELLGSIGEPGTSQDVDPALKQALLSVDDLPSDFFSFGDFSFSTPTEYGDMDMAASMFISGDFTGEEFDAMVMSAVVALPPEALDEFGDLSELQELTEADLADLEAEAGGLADIELLDASGLGDGGFGMRMAMDFGGLAGAFGAPADETEMAGIVMEMYGFFVGDQMLMVVVMWPIDQSPDVDARELAERMDAKA